MRHIKPASCRAFLGTIIAKAKLARRHTTLFALVVALVQQAPLNARSRDPIEQRYVPRTVEDVLGPLSRNSGHQILRMLYEVCIELCVLLQSYFSVKVPIISRSGLGVFVALRCQYSVVL